MSRRLRLRRKNRLRRSQIRVDKVWELIRRYSSVIKIKRKRKFS